MSAHRFRSSVIIPQYGQTTHTQRIVQQLQDRESKPFELILVDDGSPLKNPFSGELSRNQIRVRQSHRGVTAAWNLGARIARGEVLVFLNNDVQMEGPVLDRLQTELDNPAISLVGANFRIERAVPPAILMNRAEPLIEGWCFAVTRRDYEELNGFDESMTLYFSDTDFQWRLRERFPARCFSVLPELPLIHEGHTTTRVLAERRKLWHQDRLHFLDKWSHR